MNAREKKRLRRIVAANADAYREARRGAVRAVMLGNDAGIYRSELVNHALMIAESVASLDDHAAPENKETP